MSGKQPTEAAQAGKSDRHAYVRNRVFTEDKQFLRTFQPDPSPELMRGLPEHSSKAPNKVAR